MSKPVPTQDTSTVKIPILIDMEPSKQQNLPYLDHSE